MLSKMELRQKQSRTMTNDILFQDMDANGVEASMIDPLVIVLPLYKTCLLTVGVQSIFYSKKLASN